MWESEPGENPLGNPLSFHTGPKPKAFSFSAQTPEQVASAGVGRSASEKELDERELLAEREKERAAKRAQIFKHSSR